MKTFQITKDIEVVCVSEKTRYGFRHVATLLLNGCEVDTAKVCYYNRTWERYEFESVLKKVVESKKLTNEQREECKAFISKDHSDMSALRIVGMAACMGDFLCSTSKERTDWKVRMLKAGLSGLEIPEDWESLSDEEKEQRLNKVIMYTKSVRA